MLQGTLRGCSPLQHRLQQCNIVSRPALRRQLFLLAGRWCQQDGLYRADYEALLARGSTRTKAVCSIARKLVPLLLAVMRSGEAFDVDRWLAHRHQRAAA
jgi:hypothetical protein